MPFLYMLLRHKYHKCPFTARKKEMSQVITDKKIAAIDHLLKNIITFEIEFFIYIFYLL